MKRALVALLINVSLALLAGSVAPHLAPRAALAVTGLLAYCGGFAMCWLMWRLR